MVLFLYTPSLQALLGSSVAVLVQESEDGTQLVDHRDLARAAEHSDLTLCEMLKCTTFYLPEPKVRTKSPTLLKILDDIQKAQEEKAYIEMVSTDHGPTRLFTLSGRDVLRPRPNGLNVAQDEWNAVRKQLGAVVNVIASMLAVATGIMYIGGRIPLATKVVLALFGALAIAAIESVLYWIYFAGLEKKGLENVSQSSAKRKLKVTQAKKNQ